MNDKEKEAFEKWYDQIYPVYINVPRASNLLQVWQAACAYKQEEITLLENQISYLEETIDSFMDEPDIVIKKLKAENEKLKKALRFTVLAAEQQYQPSRPLQEGLCPTFYFTLSYEGDLELIEETKRARQVLKELDEE